MGTLWPLRDKFTDFSKTGHLLASFYIDVTFPKMHSGSLEDEAKPFNSLYWDYSNQMSQWYKIIPQNWRVPTAAGASYWEKIPSAGRTQAECEWKSKFQAQREGLEVSILTHSTLFPPHWLSEPLPSVLCTLTNRPYATTTIIRFEWARDFRIEDVCWRFPGPTKEISRFQDS